MNNFIKQVIEEKFASKSQQKFFFAKANEKGASKKEKKKWSKMAQEFSDKTDYSKLPNKKDEVDELQSDTEFNEIVDKNGNIMRSKKPTEKRETIWEQEYRLKQKAKQLLIKIKQDEQTRNN